MEQNKGYYRAKQFASVKENGQFSKYEDAVLGYLNRMAEEQKNADIEQETRIAQAYAERLNRVQESLERRREEIIEQCQAEYMKTLREAEQAETKEELQQAILNMKEYSFIEGAGEQICIYSQKADSMLGRAERERKAMDKKRKENLLMQLRELEKEYKKINPVFGFKRRSEVEQEIARLQKALENLDE